MPGQVASPIGLAVRVVVFLDKDVWSELRFSIVLGTPLLKHTMSNARDTNRDLAGVPLPSPLDSRSWDAVVRELELAPQQERIVRLLMQSKGDKQIASELGIAFPTVRTYLNRVFERAGVSDRMELVHRVYALAIDAWVRGQSPHT
jgi:DNA-binding CsgD family transcriptional regulator